LPDREQARHTATLLKLTTHEVARAFRRDQDDVESFCATVSTFNVKQMAARISTSS